MRQMTVAEDHHVCGRASEGFHDPPRRSVRPRKYVGHENPQFADRFADDFFPIGIVIVPAHERHGRNLPQAADHVIAADVAGMHDVIGLAEDLRDALVQHSMCIGDDADQFQTLAFFAHSVSVYRFLKASAVSFSAFGSFDPL